MAEIERRGLSRHQPMLVPPSGENPNDNVGTHFPHHEGFLAWPFNVLYKFLPECVDIIIPTQEIGEVVQRQTNYADNASQQPNSDNVLVCRYDNKTYIDLLNDALTAVFLVAGKMFKREPICLDGKEIRFSLRTKWNYDSNSYQVLAHTIEQYIVQHIVRDWLVSRNSDMAQAKDMQFQQTTDRLISLVNWREKVQRRPIDPVL